MVRISDGYDREAMILKRIISRHKASNGKALLDAGCGTGGHLRYLADDFDCTGLDLYEGMLRVARKSVPRAQFVRGNMTDFHLGRKFDVILCMYGAIGLVRTYRNLQKTILNFSRHLSIGGIVIIESDSFSNSQTPSPYMNVMTAEEGNTKVAKVEYYRRKGDILVEREDYLVATGGKGIRHYSDVQYVGVFELKKTMQIFERTGLEPRYLGGVLHHDRGVLIGIRLAQSVPTGARISL
jgi:SAM-dependent methyltransferase